MIRVSRSLKLEPDSLVVGAQLAVFATEFPVVPTLNRGRFAAQAIAWVKGMANSTLFDQKSGLEKLDGEATIKSPTGESLTLRECGIDGGFVIGARHEIPDDEGRIWRSEVILKSVSGTSALRSRTQCILLSPDAKIQTPRKPFFIKLALDDEWADFDGTLQTSSSPKMLGIGDLPTLSEMISGEFQSHLPVVFVSRPGLSERGLDQKSIDSLAFRLGGIAHVLVEPSREFSRRLQAATGGKNPYGGAVGISIAGLGVARRFMIGHALTDGDDLVHAVYDFCASYVSNRRATLSWEWQDLLEEYNRQLRKRADASAEDLDIWNQLRDEENSEKDLQINTLREQVETLQNKILQEGSKNSSYLLSSIISDKIGKEIYENEFSDRILLLLKDIKSGKVNLDSRTGMLISKIISATRFSGGAAKLEERIKNAGRDSSTADARLGELLIELGFRRRTHGHPVYTADELYGVGQQTLSCSPSDHRAGRNAASQIVRDLGLGRLRD